MRSLRYGALIVAFPTLLLFLGSLSGCDKLCGPLSSKDSEACKNAFGTGGAAPTQGEKPYVIATFECYDRNGEKAGHQCQVRKDAVDCQTAVQGIDTLASQKPDVCEVCPGTGQQWPGYHHIGPPIFSQGGSCWGWGNGAGSNTSSFSIRRQFLNSAISPYPGNFLLVANDIPPKKERREGPEVCEQECAINGTFCLRLKLKSEKDAVRQVEGATNMLADKSRVAIKSEEFMRLFGQDRDPCNRGDTTLDHESIVNIGQQCNIDGEVQAAANRVPVLIHLPEVLAGLRLVQSRSMVLTFPNEVTAPVLQIKDARFDQDYGGVVERVSASVDQAVISTVNGCISVTIH